MSTPPFEGNRREMLRPRGPAELLRGWQLPRRRPATAPGRPCCKGPGATAQRWPLGTAGRATRGAGGREERAEDLESPAPRDHPPQRGPQTSQPGGQALSEALTFRVIAGFKDVQLVGIVCERKHLNHGVQNHHDSGRKSTISILLSKSKTQTFRGTCSCHSEP